MASEQSSRALNQTFSPLLTQENVQIKPIHTITTEKKTLQTQASTIWNDNSKWNLNYCRQLLFNKPA